MAKATDKGDTTQEQAAPAPKKSKSKLLLIILLTVMTGFAGFFGWKYFSQSPVAGSTAASSVEDPESAEESAAAGHDAEEGADGEPGNESALINFEPFLVNLADEEAIRYLRVTIRLKVTNKVAAEKIAATEVLPSQIRDAILATLATRVAAEIVRPEGKEALKAEIMEKLNVFLPDKPVKAVYFTDFVVQL